MTAKALQAIGSKVPAGGIMVATGVLDGVFQWLGQRELRLREQVGYEADVAQNMIRLKALKEMTRVNKAYMKTQFKEAESHRRAVLTQLQNLVQLYMSLLNSFVKMAELDKNGSGYKTIGQQLNFCLEIIAGTTGKLEPRTIALIVGGE